MKNHDKMKYIIPDIKDLDFLSGNNKADEECSDKIPDDKQTSVTNTTTYNDLRWTMREQNLDSNNVSSSHIPQSSISKEDNSVDGSSAELRIGSNPDRPALDPSKMTFDPTCLDCRRQFKEPKPEELVMYLHALRYKVCLTWIRYDMYDLIYCNVACE